MKPIYQFVYRDKAQGGQLYTHLRQNRRKRRERRQNRNRRGQIPNRVNIESRNPIVDRKEHVGDWEVDLIICKDHQGVFLSAAEKTKFLSS